MILRINVDPSSVSRALSRPILADAPAASITASIMPVRGEQFLQGPPDEDPDDLLPVPDRLVGVGEGVHSGGGGPGRFFDGVGTGCSSLEYLSRPADFRRAGLDRTDDHLRP